MIRSVLWQRLDEPAMEHCRLFRFAAGYRLEGTVVASIEAEPATCSYQILCSHGFATREVRVDVLRGSSTRRLELAANSDGQWRMDGRPLLQFRDHHDIDLAISPSTNTLPIRRLNLAVGESRDVTALWITFPDLALNSLPQRYTRTGERTYSYESGMGAFHADLEVDGVGLIVRYGSYWQRLSQAVVPATGSDESVGNDRAGHGP